MTDDTKAGVVLPDVGEPTKFQLVVQSLVLPRHGPVIGFQYQEWHEDRDEIHVSMASARDLQWLLDQAAGLGRRQVEDALLDMVGTAGGEWRYFASKPSTVHTVELALARRRA